MLKDSFGRIHNYLRISVTDKCNFRCFYCKPFSQINWNRKSEILTFEETIKLVRIFASLGFNKIRITGGEPLLRKNIENLIKTISSLEGIEKTGITTNGYFLKEKIKLLKNSGLQLVNVSLDTLREDRFTKIAEASALTKVLAGIEDSVSEGFEEVKINTVIIKDFNDDEILDFVNYAKDKNIYLRFIEFMPFFNNGWGHEKFISNEKIKKEIERSYKLFPLFDSNKISVNYKISGHKGRIGFISSNSASFCRNCSRIRLTADGRMKLCLFENESYDLKSLLRKGSDDVTIKAFIKGSLMLKWPEREMKLGSKVVMTQIGG